MLLILRIAYSDVSIHTTPADIHSIPYYPSASVGRTWRNQEAANQGAWAREDGLKRVGDWHKGFIRKLQEGTAFIPKWRLMSVGTIISKVSTSLEGAYIAEMVEAPATS
jgi:hypothetical protein